MSHHPDKRSSRLSVISSIFGGSGTAKPSNGGSSSSTSNPSSTRSMNKSPQPVKEKNLNHAANQRSIHSPKAAAKPVFKNVAISSPQLRKPPPQLMDNHKLNRMASFDSTTSVTPMSKSDKIVRNDIDGIIGSLEDEILLLNVNTDYSYDDSSPGPKISPLNLHRNQSSDSYEQYPTGKAAEYQDLTPQNSLPYPTDDKKSLDPYYHTISETDSITSSSIYDDMSRKNTRIVPPESSSSSSTFSSNSKGSGNSNGNGNMNGNGSVSPRMNGSRNNGTIPLNSQIFNRSTSINYPPAIKRNIVTQTGLIPTVSISSNNSSTLVDNQLHKKSGSISSAYSLSSGLNVNLSSLKKKLDLKPGEGDRSSYVMMLRKTAGTAFNDVIPIKWKLPIGIRPIDTKNSARYQLTNSKIGQSYKSGVELKHGHLERRLLASEIDENEEGKELNFINTATNGTPDHSHAPSISDLQSMNSMNLNNTPNTITRTSSISNTSLSRSTSRATATSGGAGSVYQFDSIGTNEEDELGLQRTNSSGSLNENEFKNGNYYQHNFGGKYYSEDKDTLNEDEFVSFTNDGPGKRLVIANPDSDSE